MFSIFLLSWKCGRRAGGSSGQVFLAWIVFGTLFLEFCDMSNLRKIRIVVYVCICFHKRRARTNDEEPSDVRSGTSHMRPIQAQKLKLLTAVIDDELK